MKYLVDFIYTIYSFGISFIMMIIIQRKYVYRYMNFLPLWIRISPGAGLATGIP